MRRNRAREKAWKWKVSPFAPPDNRFLFIVKMGPLPSPLKKKKKKVLIAVDDQTSLKIFERVGEEGSVSVCVTKAVPESTEN